MADGGAQVPFKQTDFHNALKGGSGREYHCGFNFFWQNFTWMANCRVPVNPGQIKDLQRFSLRALEPPRHLDFTTVIAADSDNMNIEKARGSLQRMSPPEPIFAVIFSIQEAINKNADEDILMAWRSAALSAPCIFEVVAPGDDRFWKSHNIRQKVIEHGDMAQLSVRQWIYDVMGFKTAKEAELGKQLGAAQVARVYECQVRYAASCEKISDSFVDSAITVHKRVLSLPVARQWLEWCEENMLTKNPWKKIGALQALVERAQTPGRIAWAVWGLTDLFRMDRGG